MKVTVEQVAPESAQEICRVITETLPDWFGIAEANQRYYDGCRDRKSFAAKVKSDYVGLIVLEFPFSNNANIYWMAVKNEWHGKNIGSHLLMEAEKYCRSKNFQSMTVETLSPKQEDANNLKTYKFYEKCGFKPLFELKPYGPENLMVYMYKSIDGLK